MRFEIRYVITCNDCAIGPRLSRGTPMPDYQPSYPMTQEGLLNAQDDMHRIEKYVIDWDNKMKGKKK